MKKIFRLVAFALALALAATAFCGCFGSGKKAPEKQVVDKVYTYTDTELVTLDSPNYESMDDFSGRSYIGQTAVDQEGYLYTIQTVDADYRTESLTAYLGSYDGGEPMQISLPVEESEDGYRGIQNFIRLPDGLLTTVYENKIIDAENYVYENNLYLEIYNTDGTLRQTLDLKKVFGMENEQEQYFSLNQLSYAAGDLFVTLYTDNEAYSNKIVRLGLDGSIKEAISVLPEGTEGYVNRVSAIGENKLLVPVETYGEKYEQKLIVLDLTTGARQELDVGTDYEIMYRSFVGADGGLYYSTENGIFTMDLTTGEKTQLMDFINSDYIYEYGNFYAISRDRFVCLSEEYEDEKDILTLSVFDKVPDEQLVPKYLITVASAGGVYNFREQIVEFNRASEEYRIKYVDYSQYNTEEDYNAGRTKLNNDIIAGLVPDVLITDQEFSAAKYINKGLFADLYTFMDADGTLTRDQFLPNVLTAFETNGKLYEIPTNVYLMGFLGQTDRIAEYKGLTMREFADKVTALPEGVSFFRDGDYSRDDLLETFFFINYGNYLDPATGLCRLNNEDFKATVEWVSTLPEKTMWEQEDFDSSTFDYEAYENMFKEGKAIAQWTSIDSFTSFQNYSYTFGDVELDFVGAPSPDRDGMVLSTTNLKFLVSAKGNFPTEAWNFVKVFFTDDNQRALGWGFPVTKSALDAEKQEALDRIAELEAQKENEESGENIDGGISTMPVYPDMQFRNATREDVEKIYGYVTGVKKALHYDESILDIIKEEASEYFGGKKSLNDVAAHAESRINIKLGEQM